MDAADIAALWLTLKLATLTTLVLLIIGTPLAWWMARSHSVAKIVVHTLVSLPLVLPPTVIGFYLLIWLGPHGVLGEFTSWLGLGLLPFTFAGLVVGSVLYSMPFAIQPLYNAFQSTGDHLIEAAATLRAGPLDRFFSVALPMARQGYLTATVMAFAHTVGEFGVVLMIGGNIPGKTRVVSVQIYDYVDALDYPHARYLAAIMLAFSCSALLLLYAFNGRRMTDQLREPV